VTFLPLDTTIPDSALIVLIGASGSGKSTLASTWPDTQVLELDRFRALVSDDFSVTFDVLSRRPAGDTLRPLCGARYSWTTPTGASALAVA
jgi:predicted kinase